jgi:hypothetical protein
VDEADLGGRNRQALIATLRTTIRLFDGHDLAGGIKSLQTFQQKVEVQIGRNDPVLAQQLILQAQLIIDVLETGMLAGPDPAGRP